jgi:hypothetical protein
MAADYPPKLEYLGLFEHSEHLEHLENYGP